MNAPTLINGKESFLTAVAREEGFFLYNSRPQRNNNPGDIEYGNFAREYGATHGDPRFAVFLTEDDGWCAMRALFQGPGYKGMTITEALNKWAPPVENRTNLYIENVCAWTGLSPNTVIDSVL